MAISKELKRCLDERQRNADKLSKLAERNKKLDQMIAEKQKKDGDNWADALIKILMVKLEEYYGANFWYELTVTDAAELLVPNEKMKQDTEDVVTDTVEEEHPSGFDPFGEDEREDYV